MCSSLCSSCRSGGGGSGDGCWTEASVAPAVLVSSESDVKETRDESCSTVRVARAELWPELGAFLSIRSEAGKRGPRSFTGQKADPVGMKLTLFLSGHEKRGAETG